jgi:phosphoribosylaminoimidazole-succinocarboxamide synthase
MTAPAMPLPLFRSGKVREMYEVDDERLLMVASDRVSAFDVVMREPVPGKGEVLNALSVFWFRLTAGIVGNHFVSDELAELPVDVRDAAEALGNRWMLVRRAERIDIECVVRGYISGSAWAEYRRAGTVAGEALPVGLVESERLAQPVFTPAIKAESGHDENISRRQLASMLGSERALQLEGLSLELYRTAARRAGERGLILADTKFEFGTLDGQLILIDEALTPDSSRYWPLDQYAPGASTSSSCAIFSNPADGTRSPRRLGYRSMSSRAPLQDTGRR